MSKHSYWEIIGEIDFLYYELGRMVDQTAKRDTLTRMIDEATGYDKDQFDDVKELVARIKELQAMLPADDPHFVTESPSEHDTSQQASPTLAPY